MTSFLLYTITMTFSHLSSRVYAQSSQLNLFAYSLLCTNERKIHYKIYAIMGIYPFQFVKISGKKHTTFVYDTRHNFPVRIETTDEKLAYKWIGVVLWYTHTHTHHTQECDHFNEIIAFIKHEFSLHSSLLYQISPFCASSLTLFSDY